MDDGFIEIVALHEIEPKFLQDLQMQNSIK